MAIELSQIVSIYLTASVIGLLHGVEPGHGWPVAALFALGNKRRWSYGAIAGAILATAHLVSSFAVVAVFTFADRQFDLTELGWLNYMAGGLLLALAIYQWRHHPHYHIHGHNHYHHKSGGRPSSLLALTSFAFVLGFIHEEEFAILALCAGRTSCWSVMATYALSVSVSVILLTLASIAAFNRLETRLGKYAWLFPKASAVILGLMGLAYLLKLI